MEDMEIVALVMPEDGDSVRSATIVFRDASGSMSVRQVAADDELLRSDITARFRLGKPILDPNSREVMGYEMERPASAAPDRPH